MMMRDLARNVVFMGSLTLGVSLASGRISASTIGTDLARDRVVELEARVEALTRRLDQLEYEYDRTLRTQCAYRWVRGDELGLQGDAL